MSIKSTLQVFHSANVRRLYFADFAIFLGFWLTFLSIIWLVYQLTQSSLTLGVIGFALNLPIFFLLPFAGVLADRMDRRTLLVWCSAGLLITPAILAGAAFMHHTSITLLLFVAPLYGAIYAIMNPAVNAYIKEVVSDTSDIHKVTGLISSNTKIAQLLAAALNGLLHLFFTIATVFVTAVLTHLLALIGFLRIKKVSSVQTIENARGIDQFVEGVKYSFGFSPFWSILLLASVGSLCVLGWQWQLPVFSGKILGGGSRTLSLLFLAGGVGGVIGGLYVSLRKYSAGLMRLAMFALCVIAICLMLFSLSRYRIVSIVITFFLDAAWVVLLATCSASLQLIVDDNKRGRVMSFYAMGVFGLMPFTNFLIGALCYWLTVSWGIFTLGSFCLLVASFYGMSLSHYREQLQALYVEKSIGELERPV